MRWVKVSSFECLREEPLHLSTGLSPLRATTISKILAPLLHDELRQAMQPHHSFSLSWEWDPLQRTRIFVDTRYSGEQNKQSNGLQQDAFRTDALQQKITSRFFNSDLGSLHFLSCESACPIIAVIVPCSWKSSFRVLKWDAQAVLRTRC